MIQRDFRKEKEKALEKEEKEKETKAQDVSCVDDSHIGVEIALTQDSQVL